MDLHCVMTFVETRKKSILDLFLFATMLGIKVNSFLCGYRNLKGSIKERRRAMALICSDHLLLGMFCIFITSMLLLIGEGSQVAFQSPPRITVPLPISLIFCSRFSKKSMSLLLGP